MGWKGTDWPLPLEVVRRSLPLVAPGRARRFLSALARVAGRVTVAAPEGPMGWGSLGSWRGGRVVLGCVDGGKWPTEPGDMVACLREAAGAADIVVFVGGDGTARLAVEAFGTRVVSLGVPSGVKVYSGVFAYTPEEAAGLVAGFLEGRVGVGLREVLDVDEEWFRRGRLVVRLYGYLRVPVGPGLVSGGKQAGVSPEGEVREIAEYFAEELVEECRLYILGPGSTVAAVAEAMGVEGKTLLGVDAVHNGRLIARDADEETLLRLVERYRPRVTIVVSPIGGQGFILGRGNQQLSPRILRLVGREGLLVVAAPSKLRGLRALRVDTGDPGVDEMLRGYVRVLVGYGRWRVMRVE